MVTPCVEAIWQLEWGIHTSSLVLFGFSAIARPWKKQVIPSIAYRLQGNIITTLYEHPHGFNAVRSSARPQDSSRPGPVIVGRRVTEVCPENIGASK